MDETNAEIIGKIYGNRFVKENEIFNFVDNANLYIFDINRLMENLLGRGVVIQDDADFSSKTLQNNFNKNNYDASQINYNMLFAKVAATYQYL